MNRKYELTQSDINNGINRFLLDVYSSAVQSEIPKLIIITAGPGAGKTGVEIYYKRRLMENGEKGAIVNSDRIAMYHPNYDEALEELPDDCYRITRQFVRPATVSIFSELMKNNINIINENTLDKGETDMNMIKAFKDAGYQVSINVIATDMFVSRLSCYEREARDLEEGEMPRGISDENQRKMYNGFIPEIFELQELGLCDEVCVYTRGESINQPKLVYKTGNKSYQNFHQAILSERCRQRNKLKDNPGEYLSRIENIKQRISTNGISKELTENAISGLERLKGDFIKELSIDNKREQK